VEKVAANDTDSCKRIYNVNAAFHPDGIAATAIVWFMAAIATDDTLVVTTSYAIASCSTDVSPLDTDDQSKLNAGNIDQA
jgi:hypothetical protein